MFFLCDFFVNSFEFSDDFVDVVRLDYFVTFLSHLVAQFFVGKDFY